jgi:hypothetical protein
MTTPTPALSCDPPRSSHDRSTLGLAGPLLAALLASACGPRPEPGAGSAGSGSSSPRADPARASQEVPPLVRTAFADNVPAFPLLSHDLGRVAVGIASPVGGGATVTYRVAITTGWAGASDPWAAGGESYPIIDPTMAAMVLDHDGDAAGPLPDPATLRARAAPITRLLTADQFTPFERTIALGPDETSLGPVKLRLSHEPRGALTVHLLDATGAELAHHGIAPQSTGNVAGLDCINTPVAGRAWLDTRRRRVLVEVSWRASAAACNTPDPEYGVWPYP